MRDMFLYCVMCGGRGKSYEYDEIHKFAFYAKCNYCSGFGIAPIPLCELMGPPYKNDRRTSI